MRVVSIKIDESLLNTLDSVAKAKGISRSEIIRRALVHYLEVNGLKTGGVRIKQVVLA